MSESVQGAAPDMAERDARVALYKRLTLGLFRRRQRGALHLDDEAALAEELDDVWRAMNEDDRQAVEEWLKTVNRRPTPSAHELVLLDRLVDVCGHFTRAHDNGYGCTHSDPGEADQEGRRSCFATSCPLACQVVPESEPLDVEALGVRGWSAEEIEGCTEESNLMLVHDDALLQSLWVAPRHIVDPTEAVLASDAGELVTEKINAAAEVEGFRAVYWEDSARDAYAHIEVQHRRHQEHVRGWASLAVALVNAGFRGDGVLDGVAWLAERLSVEQCAVGTLANRAFNAEDALEKAQAQLPEALRQKARETEGDDTFYRSRRRAFEDAAVIVEAELARLSTRGSQEKDEP